MLNSIKVPFTRKNFNELDKFSRSKIKKIRKKLHKIENNENLSRQEKEKIEKYLTELEKSLNKFKKYYDYDDPDYKGIRDVIDLFDEITEDYYKLIRTCNSAFNYNYKEYGSRGDKDKKLSPEEYFDKIRSYLRNFINDDKAPMKLRVHSGKKIIDCKTQFGGEWILFLLKILKKFVLWAQIVIKYKF